jgi:hypothetical protein
MNHLAILKEPWYLLFVKGIKTIESRWSINKIIPYQKVNEFDWIYPRLSGDFVVHCKAKVIRTLYSHSDKTQNILRQYQKQICIDESYIQSKPKAQYLSLFWVEKPIEILPFPFVKHDQRAWIVDILPNSPFSRYSVTNVI